MSTDRNDQPEAPPSSTAQSSPDQSSPVQSASGQRRPALADRQTLDRKTIDDSFERKRRELGFPVSAPAGSDPDRGEPTPSAPSGPPSGSVPAWLDSRRRALVAAALLVGVSLTLGLVAGTCFGGSPEPPLEALGIGPVATPPGGSAIAEGTEGALDPEQEAFAERRERELAARQEEPEPGSTVPDFTDHALVRELAGSWRLDLGRGRRGYRARFGSDPVRTVHRQRYDVTLFDVVGLGFAGRGLPPYFTVLDLPDGKLLAFLDASGTFRLVLEDVRREPDGRLSWRGPQRQRRYGERLDGPSVWHYGVDREGVDREGVDREGVDQGWEPSGRADPEPAEPEWTDGRGDDQPRAEGLPGVGIRSQPGPVSEDVRARLYDALERHLDELSFGLMERDADRIYALWGGRPDESTRGAIEGLLERYTAMRVWTRPLSVDAVSTADGPQARFEVVVTIQGAPRGARNPRDVDVRDIRWRGRIGLRGAGDGGPGGGNRDQVIQLDPLSR